MSRKIIDRGRLKEINHRLLLGDKRSPAMLKPLIDGFAKATLANNIRPGARAAIARDKAQGRRVVMATASYRFYAARDRRARWGSTIASAPIRSSGSTAWSMPRSTARIATARPSWRWSSNGSAPRA